MNNEDNINDYIPSILNPRSVKKLNGDLTLTQKSIVSHCSLSLKRKNGSLNVKKNFQKPSPFDKENLQANSFSAVEDFNWGHQDKKNNQKVTTAKNVYEDKIIDEVSLDFSALEALITIPCISGHQDKETSQNNHIVTTNKNVYKDKNIEEVSIDFSALEDFTKVRNNSVYSSLFSYTDIEFPIRDDGIYDQNFDNKISDENISLISVSSATDLTVENKLEYSNSTVPFEINEKPVVSVSFGVDNYDTVNGHTEKKKHQNNHKVPTTKKVGKDKNIEELSLVFSALEDWTTVSNFDIKSSLYSDIEFPIRDDGIYDQNCDIKISDGNKSLISVSSATDLAVENKLEYSNSTVTYEINEKPVVSVSFGVDNCDTVNVSTKNSNIKNIVVSHNHYDNRMDVDCEVIECGSSHIPILISDEEMNEEDSPSPPKRTAIAVNLEIKRSKTSEENAKVLILNTDAIEKLSHVIIQPPNYKLVKRKLLDTNKFKNSHTKYRNGAEKEKVHSARLKQQRIDSFLNISADVIKVSEIVSGAPATEDVACDDGQDMSKNSGVADAVKDKNGRALSKGHRKENEASSRSIKVVPRRETSPRQQTLKLSSSEAPRAIPRSRNDSAGSVHSPRKNIDSVQFSLPKSRSNRNSLSPRLIPHFKIVAGTHFAVDAFSYGDIPNVKHYFLTHFHSDHYAGLKKGFSQLLFCSKITADLCISRLGVGAKSIHIINCDETLTIEGVEITAVDANHCPGALMLVFTLPNGKTLLHTGDFRASPLMESYPIFWNKDIHSIYLDTTYCNPRYDFPTQDQSLEMALFHLRQKKLDLEKAGKKFSSVLIVCGTYTIGKEKFFLGMARRVGCSVWACPEKDRVLQVVEGRSFSHAPAHSCQLHVVPMRDLTHEKLRSYLDSLHGAFSEVVAFKPSGWENGKNSTTEKNLVTIHGIPYSEHSSFSELVRFVMYLKPKQVVPTVDISGGVKSVQKYFPCPLVCKEELQQTQSKLTDYFSAHHRHPTPLT